MSYETPSRGDTSRSYSPGSQRGDHGSYENRDPAVISQLAAFQAVDQQILARRIKIPTKMVDAIPLKYTSPTLEEEAGGGENSIDLETDSNAEPGVLAPSEYEEQSTPALLPEEKTASVSHVLTNAIILQSFLFELASLVQVRAGLFDEVRFV